MKSQIKSRLVSAALCVAAAVAACSTTGCQVSIGGQTLPSPYYMSDDIQYFPRGPEFKLQNEAAALKEARAEASKRR